MGVRIRPRTSKRVWIVPLCFIAPYFVFYLVFSLYPTLFSMYLSLTDWDGIGSKDFVGFANYVRLFTRDKYFAKSLGTTALLAAGYAPIQMIVSMFLAVLLTNRRCKLKKLHQTSIFMPYLAMPVAVGIIFQFLFANKGGVVNNLLTALGQEAWSYNWLNHTWSLRMVVMLIVYWKYLGYIALLFMAGMTDISPDYYEAAEIDGANAWQRFWRVTLPLMKPVLIFVMITSISGCLQLYDEPFMLTGEATGGPGYAVMTSVMYLFDTAYGRTMKYGYASAVSYTLFVIIVTLSLLGRKLMTRRDEP